MRHAGNRPSAALGRGLRALAYVLILVSTTLLCLVWVAMQSQVALAGLLNGDTVWMAARARATVNLLAYSETGDAGDYARFNRDMAVLGAFRTAREAVLAEPHDYPAVYAALKTAGVDLVNMRHTAHAFAYLHRAPYVREAVYWWQATDVLLDQLRDAADRPHQAFAAGGPAATVAAAQRRQITALDATMARANDGFSEAIVRGAVVAGRTLYAAIFLLAAAAVVITTLLARRILNHIRADQDKLERLALHDPLTGLINRVEFERRCRWALRWAVAERRHVALLFLDLDGFKAVNDRYGHATGDRLLRLVAGRIRGPLRGSDAASRIGGDEFLVLLIGMRERDDVTELTQRLSLTLARPYQIDGHEIRLGSSIGIAVSDVDGNDVATLIANADAAMYLAKQHKPNAWRFHQQPERTAGRAEPEPANAAQTKEHGEIPQARPPLTET